MWRLSSEDWFYKKSSGYFGDYGLYQIVAGSAQVVTPTEHA